MAVVRLAVALCILATYANGCSQHGEALVADSAAEPVRGRSLLKYTTTHADGTRIVRKCGVASTSALKKQAVQNRLHPYMAARVANAERAMPIVINVYVTINRNGGLGDISQGDITDANVANQIAYLNDAYGSSAFSFLLAKTTRIKVAAWWNLDVYSQAYYDFRVASHQGNFGDLNIMTTSLRSYVLGVTTLPWDAPTTNGIVTGPLRDAVIIHPSSFFGGAYGEYNLGATTAHEVGHWFGLLHTFDGGCSEPNDHVTDTAEEAGPQFHCPNPAPSSCGAKPSSQPPLDPIHNFMDYSPDACMTSFTPGQNTRMSAIWDTYRARYRNARPSPSPSSRPPSPPPSHPPPHPPSHSPPRPPPRVPSRPPPHLSSQTARSPWRRPPPPPRRRPPPPPRRRPPPPPRRRSPPQLRSKSHSNASKKWKWRYAVSRQRKAASG